MLNLRTSSYRTHCLSSLLLFVLFGSLNAPGARAEDVASIQKSLQQELSKPALEIDVARVSALSEQLEQEQRREKAEQAKERAQRAAASGDTVALTEATGALLALQAENESEKKGKKNDPDREEEEEDDGSWDNRLAFSIGAAYLDPFEIEQTTDPNGVTTALLQKGDTETRAAAELSWRDRWSWREDAPKPCNQLLMQRFGSESAGCGWSGLPFDFEARAGVVLKSSKDADGSSVTGASGEAWGTLIGGVPLWRMRTDAGNGYSVNFPELAISYVSDEGAKDLHSTYIGGASLAWASYVLPATKRRAEGLVRMGFARAEVPKLIEDTRRVELEHDFPEFEGDWGGALDVEFNVPVGDRSYFQLRSSFLTGFDPNPWALYFGWVTPLDPPFVRKILPGAIADLAGVSGGEDKSGKEKKDEDGEEAGDKAAPEGN